MPQFNRLAMAGVALALLVQGPLFAAASVDGSFERTYSVTGPVDLEVQNHSGDISIRGGPPGSVTVRGKIHVGEHWFRGGDHRADVDNIEKDPPIRQSGNSIRIDYLSIRDISVDYEISAPPDTSLRLNDGSGNQELQGLRGTIDLEAGSGDVRLRDIVSSRVSLHDGSGDIVAQVSGPLTAEAGSGRVRLEEKGEGEVRIRTGSGDIEVRGVNGALRVESGSGDTEISGTNTGTWEVRTGSGNVEITLPAEAAFDLDATTGSGSIVTDRAISMTVQGDLRKSERTIRGKVAGGGPLLKLHTGSGDIRIH